MTKTETITQASNEDPTGIDAETQDDEDKPDFSNYTWFPGVKRQYSALSVSTHEGRLYVGLKGYDKRSNGPGYIQAEFSADVLGELQEKIGTLSQ